MINDKYFSTNFQILIFTFQGIFIFLKEERNKYKKKIKKINYVYFTSGFSHQHVNNQALLLQSFKVNMDITPTRIVPTYRAI
jgi:hypothetical protein